MVASIARWNLALAEWLRGRLAEAERALLSTISEWRAVGERGLAAVMRDHLGQVHRAQGRLDAAHGTYREALAITAPPGGPAMPGAGAAHVGLAKVAYERNELDTALRHITQGIPLCRQFVYTPPLATGLATLAWIRQANGDPGGASEAMGQAERAAPGPGVTVLLNPVPVQRAGCSWPRATCPRPPAGPASVASARTMSRATRGSRSTWCWRGYCSPRTAPVRHSRY